MRRIRGEYSRQLFFGCPSATSLGWQAFTRHPRRKKVDRLPLLVSGLNIDELLSVQALACRTGHPQVDSICLTVKEWKSRQIVAGLCCDTIAKNTGHKQ